MISKTLCTTWYVFTDGAYEPDSDILASIGAVLISPTGTPVQCFGEAVSGRDGHEALDEISDGMPHSILS